MEKEEIEYFAKQTVDAGFRVPKELGPGLLESVLPVHAAQLISYLKIADKRIGFLINFNVPVFKDGIHRYVNNY
jgi:hypothetical protein